MGDGAFGSRSSGQGTFLQGRSSGSCMRITRTQQGKKVQVVTRKRIRSPISQSTVVSRINILSSSGLCFVCSPHFPSAHDSIPNCFKMSPIAAAVAPGSASKDYKNESTLARLLGSGMFYQTPRDLIICQF